MGYIKDYPYLNTYLFQIITTDCTYSKSYLKVPYLENIQDSKRKIFQKQKWLVTICMKRNLLLFQVSYKESLSLTFISLSQGCLNQVVSRPLQK